MRVELNGFKSEDKNKLLEKIVEVLNNRGYKFTVSGDKISQKWEDEHGSAETHWFVYYRTIRKNKDGSFKSVDIYYEQ